MDKLNKSLEKTAINFDVPITTTEIEAELFKHLRKEANCDISYGSIRGEDSLGGTITPIDSPIILLRFKTFRKLIELELLDYGEEVREEQLKLVTDLRQKTQNYFSQRAE